MLELYAMKVARTVLRGGKCCKMPTYLNRPCAALLKPAARRAAVVVVIGQIYL